MSPLVAAPNRGYADWQRVENYDSGVLWAASPSGINTPTVSPVLDMSRYAYMGGVMFCSIGTVTISIVWYADAGATVQLAQRLFILSSLITRGAQLRIPNLGPFCIITCTTVAGANYNCVFNVIGTNRVHPLEFIPVSPQLITVDSYNVNAGASVRLSPQDYYAGPIRIAWLSGVSGSSLTVQWQDGTAALHTVDIVSATAGLQQIEYSSVAPAGFWSALTQNPGPGNGGYSLQVTGSLTGSF